MDLAETLENFHITSPLKQNSSKAADMKNQRKRNSELKPYKENENPLPQQFGSFLGKMDEWSVDYGTVKASKTEPVVDSSSKKSVLMLRQGALDDDLVEKDPQAQWKNYLLKAKGKNHSNFQKDTSDLVVTASLSDLSLIPTDTFKKRERIDVSSISQETDPAKEAKSVFNNVLKHQRSNYFKDNETSIKQDALKINKPSMALSLIHI